MRDPAVAGPLGTDFRRLWSAFAFSEAGVAFSAGALAVTAIDELGASAAEVAVVFGVGGVAAALAALPAGPAIERRQKRHVLIRADAGRAIATMAIPVLLWSGGLRLWHLVLALAINTSLAIAFSAASGAHLKQLVPASGWSIANARFESTRWATTALITPLGGLVVALAGPGVALTVDAATYVVSALLIRTIRAPEPAPHGECGTSTRWAEIAAGWTYIASIRPLRDLFANAMVFGGFLTLASPLLAVLILRDLALGPTEYGLVLGVPAVGGVIGAHLSPRLERRLGWRAALLGFGTLRTLWMFLIPISPPGWIGFAMILIAEFLLMLTAGVFNPVFATYRLRLTADHYMARVGATWSISARVSQPVFILGGGALSAVIGIRATIAVAAVGLAASSALLPWAASQDDERESPVDEPRR